MASNNNSSANGGIGFAGLLAVLFIGLKLGHVIGWSWWWVLSPLWIGAALAIGLFIVFVVIALIVAAFKRPSRSRNRY